MGFSAIARVTEEKWINCSSHDTISFGLRPGDELNVETTISREVRQHRKPVIIDHVEKDPVYRLHPTPALYGFQSYISVPILRKNGEFFGTLCALHSKPSSVSSSETISNFHVYADLISCHLDSLEQKELKEAEQKRNQEKRELLDSLVGVLGHDLRNPLATSRMSAEILLKLSKDEMFSRHSNMIKSSSYRMEAMIQNIMDLSRKQLGFEMELRTNTNTDELEKSLQQVLKEASIIAPDRVITSRIELPKTLDCDPERIGQLCSNLLKDAESLSVPHTAIEVKAASKDGEFTMSVGGTKNKFADVSLLNLKNHNVLGENGTNAKKLNLEFDIASEIARAHGGTLAVSLSDKEFCFTFRTKI